MTSNPEGRPGKNGLPKFACSECGKPVESRKYDMSYGSAGTWGSDPPTYFCSEDCLNAFRFKLEIYKLKKKGTFEQL